MNTWKIAYTVTVDEYEYSEYFTIASPADRLGKNAAAEAVADHWFYTDANDPDEQEAREHFVRCLRREGCAFLPYDTRAISGLWWEKVPPITVTIRNGRVAAVTGLPAGAVLRVRHRGGDGPAAGNRPGAAAEEWIGPL